MPVVLTGLRAVWALVKTVLVIRLMGCLGTVAKFLMRYLAATVFQPGFNWFMGHLGRAIFYI